MEATVVQPAQCAPPDGTGQLQINAKRSVPQQRHSADASVCTTHPRRGYTLAPGTYRTRFHLVQNDRFQKCLIFSRPPLRFFSLSFFSPPPSAGGRSAPPPPSGGRSAPPPPSGGGAPRPRPLRGGRSAPLRGRGGALRAPPSPRFGNTSFRPPADRVAQQVEPCPTAGGPWVACGRPSGRWW